MSDDTLILFTTFYLAEGRILEPSIFLEEDFCSLVVSVAVAKRTSGQKCEIVGSLGLLDVSSTLNQ